MKSEYISILQKLEELSEHVRRLIIESELSLPSQKKDIKIEVTNILQKCGITANLKGYHNLRDAIIMAIEDMSVVNRITSHIYPTIASKYGATPSSVERTMRHAIEISWSISGATKISDALGCIVSNKPTVSRFIAMIADKIRMEG